MFFLQFAVFLLFTRCFLAHQSHAKSFIISKLKAKCKDASQELKILELREAEIDKKQQFLRELKARIERNASGKIINILNSAFPKIVPIFFLKKIFRKNYEKGHNYRKLTIYLNFSYN